MPRELVYLSVALIFFFAQQPLLHLPPPNQWARASSFTSFLDHTQRHTTVGRTPLDEWSASRRDLYLTTHNTHNIHAPGGDSKTHNPSKRAAAVLRLWPRGHRDRPVAWLLLQSEQTTLPGLSSDLPRDGEYGGGMETARKRRQIEITADSFFYWSRTT